MRLLVVVAVPFEADAVTRLLPRTDATIGPYKAVGATCGTIQLDVVVGGVGPAAAAAATATALAMARGYDGAVSAGIAGAFRDRGVGLGDLVVASQLIPADFGVHLDDGLIDPVELQWLPGLLLPDAELSEVFMSRSGCHNAPVLTLVTMTGTDVRASELAARHPTAVAEAMEGVGLAIAAAAWSVPFAEVRTISNLVGRYDKTSWTKTQALDQLAATFAGLG